MNVVNMYAYVKSKIFYICMDPSELVAGLCEWIHLFGCWHPRSFFFEEPGLGTLSVLSC